VNIDNALDKSAEPPLKPQQTQQKPSTDASNVSNASNAAQNATGKAAPTPAASDSVLLSPQYQALAKSVANSSSFNADKVASIKASIASGKFTVDPGKIADGVIATAQDLINANSKAA
jgi:negative regulator of flagellin synthesis FlgM